MCGHVAGVGRTSHLYVALRQFIAVFSGLNDAPDVANRGVLECNLGDKAMMGALSEVLVNQLTIDVQLLIVKIEETAEIGPLLVALLDCDSLNVRYIVLNRIAARCKE